MKYLTKRARNVNFSKREEELLVELVTANSHIIDNKKTDAIMWKEKEACWKRLVMEFNSQALLIPRTVSQLQLKYKNIKKLVRKKSASIRLERLKTGGGSNNSIALNDTEEKVKDMMKLSVEGMPSQFDCDGEIDEMPSTYNYAIEVADDDFSLIDYHNDDSSDIVTVMPNEVQPFQTPTKITEPGPTMREKSASGAPTSKTTVAASSSTHIGQTDSRWSVVTPQHLKSKISTPLKTPYRKKKSRTAEATHLLQHKNELVELQIKCLRQEVEINDVKKKNIILEGEKLKLEIEVLKKKLQ